MLDVLSKGQSVQFSEAWLTKCSDSEQRRYRGRVGQVEGYRLGARNPIILFPRDGRFKEVKLFEVDPSRLEFVPNV